MEQRPPGGPRRPEQRAGRRSVPAAPGLRLAAAAVARLGLTARPPRAAGRPSVRATWPTNALLWSSAPRRQAYLTLWVPNGLIVGCESPSIPYDPRHAGLLLARSALGLPAGDLLTGRALPPRWRPRLGAPLRLLLAAPYLVFATAPPLPLALAAVTLASLGFSASLLLQERPLALTPGALGGHALGLHSSGMLACQGLGALLAGGLAPHVTPAAAMALPAAASVAVTLAPAPGLRAGSA